MSYAANGPTYANDEGGTMIAENGPDYIATPGPVYISSPMAIARNHRMGGTVARVSSVTRSTLSSKAR